MTCMTGREACAEGRVERLSQRPSRGQCLAPADRAPPDCADSL